MKKIKIIKTIKIIKMIKMIKMIEMIKMIKTIKIINHFLIILQVNLKNYQVLNHNQIKISNKKIFMLKFNNILIIY